MAVSPSPNSFVTTMTSTQIILRQNLATLSISTAVHYLPPPSAQARVVIQAGQKVYDLSRPLLELHSKVLKEIMKPQRVPGEFVEQGSSDENPFVLYGMTSYDFDVLLRIMHQPPVVPLQDSADNWLALLRTATKWGFAKIRRFLILALDSFVTEQMLPLDVVLLARELKVHHWLLAGYGGLISRKEPLSGVELHLIGPLRGLKLLRERERCFNLQHRVPFALESASYGTYSLLEGIYGLGEENFGLGSICKHSHSDAIRELFRDELIHMEELPFGWVTD